MTTGDELRDHIPPDRGSGLVASWPDGDGAGPSDYARRRWVAGMTGRANAMRGRKDWAGDSEEDEWGSEIRQLSLRSRSPLCHPEGTGTSSGVRTVVDPDQCLSSHSPRCRNRRTRQKHPSLPLSSLVPAFLLPLLPTTSAAPPHARQTPPFRSPPPAPRPAPPPRPTQSRVRRDVVKSITSAPSPSDLPMESQLVAETLLPFIISQGPDGYWTKVDEGWRLYGRQSGEPPIFVPDNPESTATSTWAITEALPPGWGVQSTRTDFYRVPLIVVASCIIAVGIVVILIIIAFKRRKAHRRAKRRAERHRRKALAAAGLTEERVNDSHNQEHLREKLDDLQRQHRAKRKGDTAVVSSTSARSKVRSWRAGLRIRRRKGGKGDDDDQDQGGGGLTRAVIEQKDEDRVGQAREGERTSADTDRSTPTVPSVEPDSSDGIGSGLNTSSSDDPTSSDLNSAIDSNRPMDATSQPRPTVPGAGSTTYFPPAYRPASVQSFTAGPSSSPPVAASSSSAHPADPPSAAPTEAEKVRAPGYYPAPATAEGEVALAVASRSEGKGRMPIPPPEVDDNEDQSNRDHTGHVATDDKRVLERLRMAASVPPQDTGEASDDGPSAPRVEVDESGFERIDLGRPSASNLGLPSAPSRSTQPTRQTHPSLPAPPPSRPNFLRSYSVEREVHEQLDELNLLPSAPPRIRTSGLSTVEAPSTPPENLDEAAVPSAPPLLPDPDDDEEGDQEETLIAPTAPPLSEATDDYADHTARDASGMTTDGEEEQAESTEDGLGSTIPQVDGEEAPRRPSEAPSEPRVFLPKYEP